MSIMDRNEPCPCGSGQKYKRCCLGREVARVDSIRDDGQPRTAHQRATRPARSGRDRRRPKPPAAPGTATRQASSFAGGYFTAELRVPDEVLARLQHDRSTRIKCYLAVGTEPRMQCAVTSAAPVRSSTLTGRVFRVRIDVPFEALPPARRGIESGASFLLLDREHLFFVAEGVVLTPVVAQMGPALWG